MTKGTLQFVPDTHVVVPKEPTQDMVDATHRAWLESGDARAQLQEAINAATQPDTPPVLRWEGNALYVGSALMASIEEVKFGYVWETIKTPFGFAKTEQEARRAAEKALGFPDWLIVEVAE